MESRDLIGLVNEIEEEIQPLYKEVDRKAALNHSRVLGAFRDLKVSDFHLRGATGYGYGDQGRDTLEKLYAKIFGSEDALVRGQIISGTHAIAIGLFGILRPGDELLSVQGPLYDTLQEIIGVKGGADGSLRDLGVSYRQVELIGDGEFDWDSITKAINPRTKVLLIQRSSGYSNHRSLKIEDLKKLILFVKTRHPSIITCVDNCYGEFVEEIEPPAAGADLTAGSLIKNPGGGLAPSGGYIAGRRDLVEMAAGRWSAPGIGREVGPSPDFQRLLYQGLYLAPHTVAESLKGAIFTARFFERLGFAVSPSYDERRTDLVQRIFLGAPERVQAFCAGIQEASPVDSYVRPEPSNLPGYQDKVIMAAGTFIQGASSELSADAPLREPYLVYVQGGLSKEYVKIAVINAARKVIDVNVKK
jgi:cystathionine beta-lyase family protein involved in aluminum resistance